MSREGTSDNALEENWSSLIDIIKKQNTCLTESNHQHDLAISNMSGELCELKQLIKGLKVKGHSRGSLGDFGSCATQAIKLDLPRFSREDPQD